MLAEDRQDGWSPIGPSGPISCRPCQRPRRGGANTWRVQTADRNWCSSGSTYSMRDSGRSRLPGLCVHRAVTLRYRTGRGANPRLRKTGLAERTARTDQRMTVGTLQPVGDCLVVRTMAKSSTTGVSVPRQDGGSAGCVTRESGRAASRIYRRFQRVIDGRGSATGDTVGLDSSFGGTQILTHAVFSLVVKPTRSRSAVTPMTKGIDRLVGVL